MEKSKDNHFIETIIVKYTEWGYCIYLIIFGYLTLLNRKVYFIDQGDWFSFAVVGVLAFWTFSVLTTFLSKRKMGKLIQSDLDIAGEHGRRYLITMALLIGVLFVVPMPKIAMEFKVLLAIFFAFRMATDFSNHFQVYERGFIWNATCFRKGEIESVKDHGKMIEVNWVNSKKKSVAITPPTPNEYKCVKKILKDLSKS